MMKTLHAYLAANQHGDQQWKEQPDQHLITLSARAPLINESPYWSLADSQATKKQKLNGCQPRRSIATRRTKGQSILPSSQLEAPLASSLLMKKHHPHNSGDFNVNVLINTLPHFRTSTLAKEQSYWSLTDHQATKKEVVWQVTFSCGAASSQRSVHPSLSSDRSSTCFNVMMKDIHYPHTSGDKPWWSSDDHLTTLPHGHPEERAIVLITCRLSSRERVVSHGASFGICQRSVPRLPSSQLEAPSASSPVITTTHPHNSGDKIDLPFLINTLQHFRTSILTNEHLYWSLPDCRVMRVVSHNASFFGSGIR
jgi:hypothetical protein